MHTSPHLTGRAKMKAYPSLILIIIPVPIPIAVTKGTWQSIIKDTLVPIRDIRSPVCEPITREVPKDLRDAQRTLLIVHPIPGRRNRVGHRTSRAELGELGHMEEWRGREDGLQVLVVRCELCGLELVLDLLAA